MDCKFCEFPNHEPDLYDAPETLKNHALHLLESLDSRDPEWDQKVHTASRFAKMGEGR